MDDINDIVVGIDLGASNYSVAIFSDGVVKTMKNFAGNRRIPSFVYFSKEEKYLVGLMAKKQALIGKTSSSTFQGNYLQKQNGIS